MIDNNSFIRIENKNTFTKFKKNFNEFIAMNNNLSYLTVHDSARPNPAGFNEAKKLAIWAKNGKHFVNLESFVEFVNEAHFDMIECLYDDPNSILESKKSVRKLFDRTKYFVDGVFAEEKIRKDTEVLMPLVGNCDLPSRKFFVDHILEANYKFNGTLFHIYKLGKHSSMN